MNVEGRTQNGTDTSVTIYGIISGILSLILIGIILAIALGIFWIVVVIIASVRANKGESYRYPLTIRFIK